MAPTPNYPTTTNRCAYCNFPCPNRHCSWECARLDRQSETTWRRAAEVEWTGPKLVAS